MGFLGFKDGCGGMQPNQVKHMGLRNGFSLFWALLDEDGRDFRRGWVEPRMGLHKQQKGRKRNRALIVTWKGRG